MTSPNPAADADLHAEFDADLLTPDAIDDPYALYARLRAVGPVTWSARHRAWIISGHPELDEAFKDVRLSTERMQGFRDRLPERRRLAFEHSIQLLDGWMLFNEAPTHTRLRDPLRRSFTPKAVSSLTADVVAITEELLDAMEEAGSFDLVEAFAHPLPANVIARLFGVPDHLRDWLGSWSAKFGAFVFGATRLPDYERLTIEAGSEFRELFGDLMAHYEANPADNLLSVLMATKDAPDGLSALEILGTCSLLLFAGHDTTASMLGSGTVALLRDPEQLAWLRAQTGDALPDTATEELLRFEPPAKNMMRIVAEDHERSGHLLRAGDAVYLGIAGANRDPRVFDEPEALRLDRDPNPHLSFGYGRHFCLGASLARLEVRIALKMLIDRFPDLRLDGEVTWKPTISDRSVASVGVRVR